MERLEILPFPALLVNIKSTPTPRLSFFKYFLIHFIIPFGEFGPPYPGKATAATQSYKCMLGLFMFPYPPNSDMDYRIFNVRTWSFLCVRGHTDSESAQLFWPRKTLTNFLLCSWRRLDSNLQSLDFESDALPTEPPRHPFTKYPWWNMPHHTAHNVMMITWSEHRWNTCWCSGPSPPLSLAPPPSRHPHSHSRSAAPWQPDPADWALICLQCQPVCVAGHSERQDVDTMNHNFSIF